jgi:hypothetical protein
LFWNGATTNNTASPASPENAKLFFAADFGAGGPGARFR